MPADDLVQYFIGLSRNTKRLIAVTVDFLLISAVITSALYVRLLDDFLRNWDSYIWLILAAPIVCIPVFVRFGLYRAVLRYIGREAFIMVFNAVTLSALIMALIIFFSSRSMDVVLPRSTVVNFWLMGLLAVGGVRYFARQILVKGSLPIAFTSKQRARQRSNATTPVAIYGAGTAGYQLYEALRYRASYRPVAFIDDDPSLKGQAIAGLKVYNSAQIEEMIKRTGATELLLAIPSLSRSRRRELLELLENYSLRVRTVPSIQDLASGRLKVDDIGEVELSDLLQREEVAPNEALLSHCIAHKNVLVTGAGGSIGTELCRQIVRLSPKRLILIEHSEFNLYAIQEEIERDNLVNNIDVEVVPVLCSIKNGPQLLAVMQTYQVDTIYHAAAYKHVPIVEHNITEGLNNNVLGTLHTAQAAIMAGVANFVLISTDKAVRPTNVMGASKRLAEMVLQALSGEPEPVFFATDNFTPKIAVPQTVRNNTRFTMVRFGNVLGSSGSVIPKFREQIIKGGPVTVTHPQITRYFMTIPEAAQLVIQAGSMGEGGDVFVLDMGEPVKILDLAVKMIHLSGLTVINEENPEGDIAIEFSGLRPGEKLFEELLIGDNVTGTEHNMIMRAQEECVTWSEMKGILERLTDDLARSDFADVRRTLLNNVKGYQPQGNIVDWIYKGASAAALSSHDVVDIQEVAKRKRSQ
ncbi:MAG: nucleoside-diphosphate sugar epimerase/dehydratase [Pseudomonadota bacterium]